MAIRIITTGGTIGGLEYTSEQDAPIETPSPIPNLLEQSRATLKISIEELIAKDSRFVTDEDRKLLVQRCHEVSEDQIVITHGTWTMAATAERIVEEEINKTIVLVGSAILGNLPNSDASFNLGSALTAVQLIPKGVYVCMNGHVFDGANVRKNVEEGTFEPKK